MPVNLENLRNRLTAALADRQISVAEAEGLAQEAGADGLQPEEAAFLREALGTHRDAFESGAKDVLTRALALPAERRDLADPAVLSKHAAELEYGWATGALFVDGVDDTDVIQGSIANCYMVASFAAVADQHPEAIENAIRDNGDGTFTVRLHEPSYYGEATSVEVVVDGQLPGGDALRYGKGADRQELWVPLLEKAFAQWKGSYDAIGNGGSPGMVMGALLGTRDAYSGLYESMDADELYGRLAAAFEGGQAVVAATHGKDRSDLYSGSGLYAWHAYTVLGVSEEGGEKFVQLRNPWGKSEPGSDGQNDGVFKLPVADFAKYYAGYWAN